MVRATLERIATLGARIVLPGHGRPFDIVDPGNAALFGTFEVAGRTVRPAFEAIRDNLRPHTPEHAEAITTVPAATIRRLARQLVDAARIGGTTTLDGEEYPLRPAAARFM